MNIPKNPLVYELHTAAFLRRLSKQYRSEIRLDTVPDAEWDKLAELGAQAVWLMGVWERSPAAVSISARDEGLLAELHEAVPDMEDRDLIGSAYSIRGYRVDPLFGGIEGLISVRQQLTERGIGLILDFVPNHVAPDHPWTHEHPDYFITASPDELAADPASFMERQGTVFAKGRDPHFAAWPDVLQLNAFSEGYRQAAIETLRAIGELCDGVRCDMAMLMQNGIFAKTWGERAGKKPISEFWEVVTTQVRQTYPEFLFLAEAYWQTEQALVEQGFDYCYDKTLYDLLLKDSAAAVRGYIEKTMKFQKHFCRFIENHDEARAAAIYGPEKAKAAVAAIATLPGMRLLHDGQLEGWRTKIPVHLAKGPDEATTAETYNFYQMLLRGIKKWRLQRSTWHPYHTPNEHVLAWHWLDGAKAHYVIINYSEQPTQLELHLPGSKCTDALLGARLHVRMEETTHLVTLKLAPWQARLLNVTA